MITVDERRIKAMQVVRSHAAHYCRMAMIYYWRLYASSIISGLHTSVQKHKQIIEGLSSGDPDAVERALQNNWLKGSERLGHVIDIFRERGSW